MNQVVGITGFNGFIGSHLRGYLLKQGYDLVLFERTEDGYNPESVRNVDVLVHLGGQSSPGLSFKEPEETFKANVLETAKLQSACLKYGKKMVFASSWAVTDPDSSPYAKSKFIAEYMLLHFKNVITLRFFNVYGSGVNERSGGLFYHFMKGINEGNINVQGNGTQRRDFIHVDDIVRIIHCAIESERTDLLIECGTGKLTSVNEIANIFKKYAGVEINYYGKAPEVQERSANGTLELFYKKPLLTNLEKDLEGMINE